MLTLNIVNIFGLGATLQTKLEVSMVTSSDGATGTFRLSVDERLLAHCRPPGLMR